eukprot:TRINITY_DN1844_c8_g1_i1.p1 TRINITY_DN1844_c8_g1~~TRINITY_DN1844_c8_g1_i1.p1  ORF type:complete len:164 (+),score=42.00 TRINITY_DN1844_c8_g1_i1:62-553(+)
MDYSPKILDFRNGARVTFSLTAEKPTVWKVLATNPAKFKIRPSVGVLLGGKRAEVSAVMQNEGTKLKISGRTITASELQEYEEAENKVEAAKGLWKKAPCDIVVRPEVLLDVASTPTSPMGFTPTAATTRTPSPATLAAYILGLVIAFICGVLATPYLPKVEV